MPPLREFEMFSITTLLWRLALMEAEACFGYMREAPRIPTHCLVNGETDHVVSGCSQTTKKVESY
jgi:hypothetical protein